VPTLAQYVTRLGQYLNAFPMETPSANPLVQATGGKSGFPDQKLERAAQDAASSIFVLIAGNPTHPRRSSLVTSVNMTTVGQLLPSHIGPIGAVRIGASDATLKHADRTSADDVQRLIDNALGLTLTAGYYGLDDERIYWTGTKCWVDMVVSPAEPMDPDLVPDEYANAVVARALAFLFPLEGENISAAQHFHAIATQYEQMIAANIAPPEVPSPEVV